MYQYVGKASPFLVLAALGFFDGRKPACDRSLNAPSLCRLLILSTSIDGTATRCEKRARRRSIVEDVDPRSVHSSRCW